ncbi:hypothetical protein POVCU2_0100300 [Plasmodium ovale curtisi]|uniref:PIR Superfamily Protein n=1 Tax=Plasmodium ovale curtisi TaxID=864141 RepID=A0A1A8WSP9_PLAOA|nr:hypothetical protein POVCU2_0100300 [Plasmodium ovale curtisi]SBS99984.1 hypothetical protein POVCU1_056550 [Plasmodium ovale curtisi]
MKKVFFKAENVDTTSFSTYLLECSDYYDEIICTESFEINVLYISQLEDFNGKYNDKIEYLLSTESDIEIE